MARTELNISSSALSAGYYDPETEALTLYWGNSPYTYHGVPQDVVDELVSAGSQGAYAVANIKDNYSFSRG